MSLIDDLEDFLPHSISIEPYSSQDEYGEPSYGVAVTYRGRVEIKNMMVRDDFGKERVASGRIFLNTTSIPTTKDRVTLPSGYDPATPEILAVMPQENETGIDHIVLMIGHGKT